MYPDQFLNKKLEDRWAQGAGRKLRLVSGAIDFCSNDYLGMVKHSLLAVAADEPCLAAGSTGSRLLSGNSALAEETEQEIAAFHQSVAALLFNSGYDANTGLLSAVVQRGDVVLYDSLCHASIRDGLRLCFGQSIIFPHNSMDELEKKLKGHTATAGRRVFVVTESVFSMDGDLCPLQELVALCMQYGAHLVVDEAHATGVIGMRGEGLVQHLGLQEQVFARMHTFGKACGCHGAAVLGSNRLREYLINFSRSLIYSTALPPQALAAIRESYRIFPLMQAEREVLRALSMQFQAALLHHEKLLSATPVQGVVIPGNDEVKQVAASLQENGLDVRAILYPTVPKGKERLRIVLHSFNMAKEIEFLAGLL